MNGYQVKQVTTKELKIKLMLSHLLCIALFIFMHEPKNNYN